MKVQNKNEKHKTEQKKYQKPNKRSSLIYGIVEYRRINNNLYNISETENFHMINKKILNDG